MAEVEQQEEVQYKIPEKVSTQKMLEADQDDESLQRWKASILGKSQGANGAQPMAKVQKIDVHIKDNDTHFVFPLSTEAEVNDLKEKPVAFRLKEGCEYTMEFTFNVENDIVMGLKYESGVYKRGVRVTKLTEMLGSYGPQAEPHVFTTRAAIAPSGMLGRGKYQAKSKFVDDDGNVYLEFSYHFEIKKDF
ncbi:RHO protein GDP dissociation inhibitor [Carpediemonas membranifera]|uniref:RHO protein GDP dissociation inhibitor n=1 Tax=Carpediemonas membranifera TaxID=201153 RepID=A0A8J6E4W7_9EUKA|nr:RHO protein GDP dissociation inhibitor [Carpediemonas membranifera]|eukprot:KAG9395032.1 RHO protein GDP dissociation inhibitor [Carpediemonas membranifera]